MSPRLDCRRKFSATYRDHAEAIVKKRRSDYASSSFGNGLSSIDVQPDRCRPAAPPPGAAAGTAEPPKVHEALKAIRRDASGCRGPRAPAKTAAARASARFSRIKPSTLQGCYSPAPGCDVPRETPLNAPGEGLSSALSLVTSPPGCAEQSKCKVSGSTLHTPWSVRYLWRSLWRGGAWSGVPGGWRPLWQRPLFTFNSPKFYLSFAGV